MSYWSSDNVVHIGEKDLEIPAERGLSYTVGATSQKVTFNIPQSVGFLDGKSSYLSWEMKILCEETLKTRLQLDPAGCGMCVQNYRLMNNGVVLEEINDCNQLVALRHDYDRDQSLLKSRALMEGGTTHSFHNAGTQGSTQTDMANLSENPWFKKPADAQPVADYDQAADGLTVKCCVPMPYSGIFSGGAFPVMLLENGLHLEIDLMPAPRIIRQLDSVVQMRRRTLNPQVLGSDAAGTNFPVAAGGTNQPYTEIFLKNVNSQWSIDRCPFVKGERIGLIETDNAAVNHAPLTDQAGAEINIVIDDIEMDGGFVKLTVNQFFNNGDGAGGNPTGRDINDTFCVVSLSCADTDNYKVEYQVDKMTMVVHQLELEREQVQSMLSEARDGSSIEFDIMSYTNYKNSQLATERQSSFLINAKNERAKSCIVIPTDSTVYRPGQMLSSQSTYTVTYDVVDTTLQSARPGISGCCDFLSEYQFQVSGINVPSRPVSTRKIATMKSIDAFAISETEKGLHNGGIVPRSFSKFMENFVICRSFGTMKGSQDLRNEDLVLQLRYSEGVAPQKNKLFSTFVAHVRRVRIKNGFVEVDI